MKPNMGIECDITDQEKEAVNELRKRIEGNMELEIYEDTYLLLRFLKARDFDIGNAEAMLRKHLQWREKYDFKNISKFKKTEFMEKHISYSFIGYDKEDSVIRYLPVGNMDIAGIIASLKFEDIVNFAIYVSEQDTEELKKQSEKLGKNIDKCIYIDDFENFTFAQATDKTAIYCMSFLMNFYLSNYPERLKAVYIINVSMYFHIMYAVIKNILPKTILSKIHLYSDDSYKEDLLKVIDADVLPAFLGGNRTDPDGNPLCLSFINHGEPVPESFYMNKQKRSLSEASDVEKVTLSRAAFHEVSIAVKEPGSCLEWEFETKCRDIGFGLFYQEIIDGEEKNREFVPLQRIDTEKYPETGMFKCDISGTYVIVFDNTYSWIREKEIYYRIKLVTPKEYEAAQIPE